MASESSALDANGPTRSSSSSALASSPTGRSRQTRIHFPTDADSPPRKVAGPSNLTGLGLRSVESNSSRLQARSIPGSLQDSLFERRRVLSANASESSRPSGSYGRKPYPASSLRPTPSSKRTASYSLENADQAWSRRPLSIGSSPLSAGVYPFSEEDGIDKGDDPNILADLHKALQFRPHVEQHLKQTKPLSSFPSSPLPPSSDPSLFNASPGPYLMNVPLPRSEPGTPVKAEFVDFSPAVGTSTLHPIPTSADDSATLDWSGSVSDAEKHERKWTMSLTRKSSKEKHQTLSRKALVEKQDMLYYNKLARIKEKANESTMRKAEITKGQLRRRYSALNASYTSGGNHLNLASVARWFDRQDSSVKFLVAENEPMPWLHHLLQRHEDNSQMQRPISPWNISAMIVEEYMRSILELDFGIPSTSPGDNLSDAGSSISAVRARHPVHLPPALRAQEGGAARKSDDMISFEPMAHSRRHSAGTGSRVSVDTQLKRWRLSLLNRTDHDLSSASSMKSRKRNASIEQEQAAVPTGRTSPSSSRSPLHGFALKKRRSQQTPLNSDDGHSSAADSMAERGKEDNAVRDKQERKSDHESKRSRFHLSLDLKSTQPSSNGTNEPEPLSIAELRTDATEYPSKTQSLPVGKETRATTSADSFEYPPSTSNKLASPIVLNSVRKSNQKKTQRLSLPSPFLTPNGRRRRSDNRSEAQNHELQAQYARKNEILDALVARNARMKGLLQLASKSINEYDETQSALTNKLGLGYRQPPPEALEALKHDPSASTGHLRNLKGWRAVEDIHNRRQRQMETLQSFIASFPDTVRPLSLPSSGIYESAIKNLSGLVERLHSQRSTVLSRVKETNDLLSKVKKMRDELKPEFDETSKHTSVNYPELVRLESLLDEFVNESNQLVKFAEASLSFLLTSVAPLMKTFGRPIWDELHDFLVIPLYRNGFSGEDHWYPVTFPKRSITHWVRLLLLANGAPFFLFQGTRVFFALLTHGYVLRVPSFVPAFLVYVLFSGIMFALASLLFGLFISVLCELFIVFWWTLWILHIVR